MSAKPDTSQHNVVEPDKEDEGPPPPSFPPYPPYVVEPAPPSVADAIVAGRDLRLQHKTAPRKPVQPPPKPARPKGPAVSDVKMSRKRARAHARCLRRHNVVLSDRLEHMARPPKRAIIQLWRDHGKHLSPETIARMRCMLDADEPFKPDQAYEYFINQRKTVRQQKQIRVKAVQTRKVVDQTCGAEKRLVWNRNATVIMARGIYQKLCRPGSINLKDGMLRLSNIVLSEICNHMHIKKPCRASLHPKSRLLTDISDRVAIMIDDVLTEAEDRMLMMDFDEDDDLEALYTESRPSDSSRTQSNEASGAATPTASTGGSPSVSKTKI